MKTLDWFNVSHELAAQVERDTTRQLLDEAHLQKGAIINRETSIADTYQTVGYLVGCIALATLPNDGLTESSPHQADQRIQRMKHAVEYLCRIQRENGLIDSRSGDSVNETAQVMQLLAAGVEIAQPIHQAALNNVLPKIEIFIRQAASGLKSAEVTTSAQRLAVVAALAQARKFYADLDVETIIQTHLKEGFGIDGEGAFTEDAAEADEATNDLALLLLANHGRDEKDKTAAHAAAVANLNFNLRLLNFDSTAEARYFRRQGYAPRTVPAAMIAPYLYSSGLSWSPGFARAAINLWQKTTEFNCANLFWIFYVLQKFGDRAIFGDQAGDRLNTLSNKGMLPEDYAIHFPLNRLWRIRREAMNATVFGGTTRLMTLNFGEAELTSLRISQSDSRLRNFTGDSLTVEAKTASLRANVEHHTVQRRNDLAARRSYRPLPPAAGELTITEVKDGFDLHYCTYTLQAGVMAQIAFDFPAGGLWETADTLLYPMSRQIIFLRQGAGRMRFGDDVIEIAPGSSAHLYANIHEAEPVAEGYVRVLLTFLTPVDFAFRLRVSRSILTP